MECTGLESFRETVKYKKKFKGADIAKEGFDPAIHFQPLLDEWLQSKEDKEIEIRIDPLLARYSLYTTLISEERAKRPIAKWQAPQLEDKNRKTKEDCDFCKLRVYLETAVPKIYHEKQNVISAPNLFPYISPHYITIFINSHKPDLVDLTENDLATYLSTGKEIAQRLKEEGLDGMWDIINWGSVSGGPQPHPHAQRGGLYKLIRTSADRESEAIEKRKNDLGEDPFEFYMKLARENNLLIYENDEAFVFAPFASRFTDQIDVLLKRNGKVTSNYLGLENKAINSISKAMAGVINKLRTERGVTDLNIETHQARFNSTGDYRMHWHIYPRKSAIAGMELNDIYIVSAYPEDTARALTPQNQAENKEGSFSLYKSDPCNTCVERLTGVAGEPCVGCSLAPK